MSAWRAARTRNWRRSLARRSWTTPLGRGRSFHGGEAERCRPAALRTAFTGMPRRSRARSMNDGGAPLALGCPLRGPAGPGLSRQRRPELARLRGSGAAPRRRRGPWLAAGRGPGLPLGVDLLARRHPLGGAHDDPLWRPAMATGGRHLPRPRRLPGPVHDRLRRPPPPDLAPPAPR